MITRYLKKAKVLQPRWQCWRCKGSRLIVTSTYPGMEYGPCPNCTSPDTPPAQIGTWRRIAA